MLNKFDWKWFTENVLITIHGKKKQKTTKILGEGKYPPYFRFFVCCHEVFLYSISKIVFPLFGNRVHITGTKITRHILNTNVNK
jgi:hypothetical protein